jgi:DNA-binding MarR family transcriptional regulator
MAVPPARRVFETVNCLLNIERMINRFIPQRPSVSKLSKLQKRILEEGLKAHWDKPIHRASGKDTPGCFGISKVLEEFFGASKEDIQRTFEQRHWRLEQNRLARKRLAAPRAAVSRAMSRLIKRGLLERISPTRRYGWRLTASGVEAASSVCPTLREPARVQMIERIKAIFADRKTGPFVPTLKRGRYLA